MALHSVDIQPKHMYTWPASLRSCPLQALAGQVEEGMALHKNWSAAWNRFGWLPEMFDLGMDNRHPTETGAGLELPQPGPCRYPPSPCLRRGWAGRSGAELSLACCPLATRPTRTSHPITPLQATRCGRS